MGIEYKLNYLSQTQIILDVTGAPDTVNAMLPGSPTVRPKQLTLFAYGSKGHWTVTEVHVNGLKVLDAAKDRLTKRDYVVPFMSVDEEDTETPDWILEIVAKETAKLNGGSGTPGQPAAVAPGSGILELPRVQALLTENAMVSHGDLVAAIDDPEEAPEPEAPAGVRLTDQQVYDLSMRTNSNLGLASFRRVLEDVLGAEPAQARDEKPKDYARQSFDSALNVLLIRENLEGTKWAVEQLLETAEAAHTAGEAHGKSSEHHIVSTALRTAAQELDALLDKRAAQLATKHF